MFGRQGNQLSDGIGTRVARLLRKRTRERGEATGERDMSLETKRRNPQGRDWRRRRVSSATPPTASATTTHATVFFSTVHSLPIRGT